MDTLLAKKVKGTDKIGETFSLTKYIQNQTWRSTEIFCIVFHDKPTCLLDLEQHLSLYKPRVQCAVAVCGKWPPYWWRATDEDMSFPPYSRLPWIAQERVQHQAYPPKCWRWTDPDSRVHLNPLGSPNDQTLSCSGRIKWQLDTKCV